MKTLINILLILTLFISCTQKEKKVQENQSIDTNSNDSSEVIITESNEENEEVTEVLKEVESEEVEKEKVIEKEEVSDNEETKAETSKDKEIKRDVVKTAPEKIFNHQKFHAFLQAYVSSEGIVNYKGMKSDEKDLDAYIKILQDNPIENDWNQNKKLAFWINAYNAFTIKLILSNYPLNSITDLEGGKPWDKKWISLNGQNYSLNDIENRIIRPRFKEARIHFAVNCAAKSCPKLGNFAYEEKTLNTLLDQQTKDFINKGGNIITPSKIQISKIFEWYAEDFGDLISFLNKYSEVEINDDATVAFKEYDWSLNE